jgi:hypothetical protein
MDDDEYMDGQPGRSPPITYEVMHRMIDDAINQGPNAALGALTTSIQQMAQQIAALTALQQQNPHTPSRSTAPEPSTQLPTHPTQAAPSLGEFSASSVPMKRKALPWPTPFDGDRKKYNLWETQIRAKITIDAAFIGDSRAVWYSINNNLTPRVQLAVSAFVKSGGTGAQFVYEDLFAHLSRAYADSFAQKDALAKLKTLKQGRQTFGQFYIRFEQLLADSGANTWPDMAKLTLLDDAMSPGLKEHLVPIDIGVDFHAAVRTIHGVASRYEHFGGFRAQEKGGATPDSSSYTQTQRPNVDTDGDTEMISANRVMSKGRPRQAGKNTTNNARRAKWVSKAEIEKRKENGSCLRCGVNGHLISTCPYLPARRPASPRETRVNRIGTDKPLLEPEGEEEEEDSAGDARGETRALRASPTENE